MPLRYAVVAAATGALLVLVTVAPASGADQPLASSAAVDLQTHDHVAVSLSARSADGGAWVLEARVEDAVLGPVGAKNVRFSATIEFLGVRPVLLATMPTDSSGTARYTYRPTWNGAQRIVARAPFDDATVSSNEFVLDVTTAPLPAIAQARLPVVGAWAGPVAALVVITIWAVLVLVLVRVVVGISRAATVVAPMAGGSGPPVEGRIRVLGSAGSKRREHRS
jgi:hypothetical protein